MSAGSFLSHIEALRKMLIEILSIFVLLLIPGWFFAGDALYYLQSTAVEIARQNGASDFDLRYFTLMEPFVIELKVGMIIALAAGLPLYFWRFWHFLAPALYWHEKRILLGGAVTAWVLFAAGAALGIWGVMPMLVKFSMSFAREGLTPLIGLGNFSGLMMSVALAFGVMFELPLVLLALAGAGIIQIDTLRKQRPLVVVVILFLAAVLTPPDVISQLMLGIPTYLLFELTLLVGSRVIKAQEKAVEPPPEPVEEAAPEADSRNAVTDDSNDAQPESASYSHYYHYRRRVRRRAPMPTVHSRYKKRGNME